MVRRIGVRALLIVAVATVHSPASAVLFGTIPSDSQTTLVTIDPGTGAASVVGLEFIGTTLYASTDTDPDHDGVPNGDGPRHRFAHQDADRGPHGHADLDADAQSEANGHAHPRPNAYVDRDPQHHRHADGHGNACRHRAPGPD